MKTLILGLSLFYSSFVWSNTVEDYLDQIFSLQKQLSKSHYNYVKEKDFELDLEQRVNIEKCELELKTYVDYGLIQRDVYDLSKLRPAKGLIKDKGTYPLYFGVKSYMFRRSKLYYTDQAERDNDYKQFLTLYKICRKKVVKEFFSSTKVEPPQSPPTFIGRIPQSENETGGKIYREGNKAAVVEGETSLFHRLKAIKEAKKNVYQQNLDFRSDKVGQLIASYLIEKKQQGLDVKVLVDGMANQIKTFSKVEKANNFAMYDNLMAAGIRVYGHSCGGKTVRNEIRGIDLSKLFRRNHEKILLTDSSDLGETPTSKAIVGGANLSHQYFRMSGLSEDSWRDFDLIIQGTILKEIENVFLRNFSERGLRYKTFGEDYKCLNPYDPIKETEKYFQFKVAHTKAYKPDRNAKDVELTAKVEKNLRDLLSGKNEHHDLVINPELVEVQGLRFINNRPEEGEDYILEAYIDLINSAREEIKIANQFVLVDPPLKKALREAANRGVKITILTNSVETNPEIDLITIVGRYYYIDLAYANHPWLNSGLSWDPENVKIYEWHGKYPNGVQAMGRYHAKVMTVDDSISVVGSHNLDNSSKKNSESLVILENPEITRQLGAWITQDLGLAKRMTYEEMQYFREPKGKDKIKLGFGLLIENFL